MWIIYGMRFEIHGCCICAAAFHDSRIKFLMPCLKQMNISAAICSVHKGQVIWSLKAFAITACLLSQWRRIIMVFVLLVIQSFNVESCDSLPNIPFLMIVSRLTGTIWYITYIFDDFIKWNRATFNLGSTGSLGSTAYYISIPFNSSSRWNGRRFVDDIFKCISLNETIWISIKISLKSAPKGRIDKRWALIR